MKQSIAVAVAVVAGLFVEACSTTTELGRDWTPYALNDAGIVVGSGKVPGTTTYRAVKYASGNLVFLPTLPGHATNSAHGIANDDTIVGSSSGSGVENAVFWDAGATIHDLGQLAPGWQTWATAINNRGVIVGGALAPDRHYHAWVYDLAVGRMASLPTLPNALDARAESVNDRGEIVGSISVNVPERPPGE